MKTNCGLVQRFLIGRCQTKKSSMKKTFLILVALALFISCKKSSLPLSPDAPASLIGRWKYSQSFYSIGGPLIYKSTDNLNQWVQFNSDGTCASNTSTFKQFTSFDIEDSIRIKFVAPASNNTRLYFFSLDSINKKLSLSPADFICIEGCGDIFKK